MTPHSNNARMACTKPPLDEAVEEVPTTPISPILPDLQSISPFFRTIPSEIRNKIYRLTFQHEDKDALTPITITHASSETGKTLRRLDIEHPLLRTCKQIRHEAAGIYYTETNFQLTTGSLEPRAMQKLHSKLSPWADKITRLSIEHVFWPKIICSTSLSLASLDLTVTKPKHEADLTVWIEEAAIQQWLAPYGTIEFCTCKIKLLEAEGRHDTVIEWACRYAMMVHGRQTGDWANALHCWLCTRDCIL